jgi:hypothetical protein
LRRSKTSIARKLAWALACVSLVGAAGPTLEGASAQEPARRPGQLWSKYPAGEERLRPPEEARRPAETPAPVRPPLVDRTPPRPKPSDRRPSVALVLGLGAVTGVLLLVLMPVALGTRVLVRAERRFTPPRGNGDNGAVPATHLVLFPTSDGYVLAERSGEAPAAGAAVEGRFAVTRVGPSPLPVDHRRCAYLEEL